MNKKIIRTGTISLFLFLFVVSFYLGWSLSDRELSNSELLIERNLLDLRSFSQGVYFIEQFNGSQCDPVLFSFMSEKLYQTGLELERLEELNLDDSQSYILLKQRHNMNQVFFYTYYKELSSVCELNSDIILFFFNGSEPLNARNQGEQLNSALSEIENDMIILPMDYGYTDSLDYFYNFFEINQLPTLIINFESKLEGISSTEQILESLEK